jgi:predicted DNA-binding transcriptional regulator YafY
MRNQVLYRQWRIIHIIYNNSIQGISKQQLADEFSVSKRTIMRDIENLSISGFPVYDEIDMDREGQVFYYMWDKYKIPEISFSYSELLAFYLLYSIYTPVNPFLHRSFQGVMDKISSTIPQETKKFLKKLQKTFLPDLYPLVRDNDPEKIVMISDAIIKNRKIEFNYKSLKNNKNFHITPLGLKYYHNNFYLAAYYEKRDTVLTFALNRMSKLTISSSFVDKVKFDIDKYFHEGYGFYPGKATKVRLQFSSEIKQIILERNWHPKQKITENEDGSMILEMPVSNLKETMWFILSYGSNVKVLAPNELQIMLKEEIENISKLY